MCAATISVLICMYILNHYLVQRVIYSQVLSSWERNPRPLVFTIACTTSCSTDTKHQWPTTVFKVVIAYLFSHVLPNLLMMYIEKKCNCSSSSEVQKLQKVLTIKAHFKKIQPQASIKLN